MESQKQATSIGLIQAEVPTKAKYDDEFRMAQEIAAGDRVLFKKLYDRNINALHNLARRMTGSSAEAEDVVQDSFVRAYQKIHLFAGRSTLSSWLYRICINAGLEHLRRRKGNFEDLTDENCCSVEPDQKKIILRRKLEHAIKKLPDGCRTIFVLHDIEGFNHREIAERLRLAEGTSKSQLFKARLMLRRILTGQKA